MKAALVRMNQCVCGASAGEACYSRTGAAPLIGYGRRMTTHHKERRELAKVVTGLLRKRAYVDALTTSYGMLVSSPSCEHCDGERSQWVRHDALRGWICPLCDDSLDAMYEGTEGANDVA